MILTSLPTLHFALPHLSPLLSPFLYFLTLWINVVGPQGFMCWKLNRWMLVGTYGVFFLGGNFAAFLRPWVSSCWTVVLNKPGHSPFSVSPL